MKATREKGKIASKTHKRKKKDADKKIYNDIVDDKVAASEHS